ncbi:MAG: class I poly(R)-hydroxyalkanoic acid synthase, partial [Phenylobacterium sp.]
MTAQGAIAEAALRQADRPAGLDADPFHVGPAMAKVMSSLASRPDALMQAQGDLWRRYAELWHFAARRAMGEAGTPVAAPAKGDKRFNAPDWTENPVFDVIKQSYLITSDWLNGLVARAEDIDPMTRRRVEFFTRMLTDALSPSN